MNVKWWLERINKLYSHWFRWKGRAQFDQYRFDHNLKGQKVVVLAPHIDDDIIGCGGAIMHYLEQGATVDIIYLTDGAQSKARNEYASIQEVRMKEAYNVAGLLGLDESHLHFLSYSDQQLINNGDLSGELSDHLKKLAPDTVFSPVFLDTHPDHFATTLKLKEAYNPEVQHIYLYEVQSPITPYYGNVAIDISEKFDKKLEMVNQYKSQKMDFSFVRRQSAFNAFCLASSDEKMEFAELFLHTTPDKLAWVLSDMKKQYDDYSKLRAGLVGHGRARTFIPAIKSSMKTKQLLDELTEDSDSYSATEKNTL